MTVCENTVIGYMPSEKLSDADCAAHITTCLKVDNYSHVTVKIFKDIRKYTARLSQMKEPADAEEKITQGIVDTLKSISL